MLNLMLCKLQQRVGVYAHIFPTLTEGKKVIWKGKDRDGRRFLDYIPGHREYELGQRGGWVTGKRDDELSITFANESIYQILGADHPDSVRGMGIVGAIISEYAFFKGPEIWDIIRPMLAENGGWIVFVTTPDGRNHSYTLHQMAERNPKWFAETLPASYTKAVDPERIQEDRDSGMSEEKIASEYECSYDQPVEGAFYGKELVLMEKEGRIGIVPHDPRLPVDTYWDLGMADAMVIIYVQNGAGQHRVIDYSWMTGKTLPQAIKLMKEKGEERDFNWGTHYGPHDLKVRELGGERVKTRAAIAKGLGVKFKVVNRTSVQDGIEATRALLATTWIDERHARGLIDGLRMYRRQKIEGEVGPSDEPLYSNEPEHSWASHPADGFRTGAMGRKIRFNDDADEANLAPKIAIA